MRSCTSFSQTIDSFIAIIGIDRIVAFFSLSTVSKLSFLLQDLIFNGIQISVHFNTGDFEGIFATYSIFGFYSKLSALFVAGPDFQWKSNRLCTSTTILETANCDPSNNLELMRCKVDIFETFERNRVRYILDIQGSKE